MAKPAARFTTEVEEGKREQRTPVDVAEAVGRRRKSGQRDSQFKISTTAPDELRRHNISDEELEMLIRDNRDGMSETFWGLVGAAIAALPSAGESIWQAYWADPKIPLSPLHLIEITVVVGAAVGATVIKIITRGRADRVSDLAADIRRRQAS